MFKAYLKYRKERVNAGRLHSPFMLRFYNEVINRYQLNANPMVEELRSALKTESKKISVTDYGAGSRKSKETERKVSEIVRSAAMPKKQGELIARIIAYYDVKSVLELGTSLGIGTAYMAMAGNDVKIQTIEGCENTAGLANENFKHLGLKNIRQRVGEFSDALKDINEVYDLIYVDGNHRLEPTVDYFEFALEHTHDDAFIIFDDIHWSKEMETAWETIKSSKKVNLSMDLFRFGIICKQGGNQKEDVVLKF